MIRRAFFYTTRKRGKTLILLLTLFVISTFVLTGLSILAAADQSALSLRQSVGGSIKLELDANNRQNWTYQQGVGGTLVGYTGMPITDADIEKVMSIKGIRSYNGVGDGSVFAMDFSFISGFSFGPGSDYSRLPSVSNSEYFNYFRRGAFKLVEGRHITPEDDHAVLISTALAERNGLKLGDTITVQCCYDAGGYPNVSLKIIGIYKSTLDDGGFTTTSTDKRNRLIIDHKAMQKIMMHDVIQYDNGVEFFVDDPRDIDKIAAQIQKLDLDWSCFKLTVDNTAYEAVASSLTAMQNMVTGLIIGIVIVSISILALILNMWIKQRTHETGILLSIGVSKAKIVAQYILETLMIAVIAFGLSYFSSGAIAQGTSNLLFSQVAETQPIPEIETPDDGTEYLDITGQYIPYDTSNMVAPDSIEVHVTAEYLLWVYLLGITICTAAVVLASLPVVKMKPKNILSQMS
ncbi:ABC transporter permease [Anaerotruncus colihominis]|uniref:ABC transporter permease n=1 Tax=Anaerotruncus colihominis TaxID=169435 RepID=UPI0035184157